MNNWISVEKQMPQEWQEVLCYSRQGKFNTKINMAIYCNHNDKNIFLTQNEFIVSYGFDIPENPLNALNDKFVNSVIGVTHWMPMPTSPSKK